MLICAKQNVGSFGARPILQQQWWWWGGGVYSSYSLATDLKSQMTFGLGCHIGWIHEWKKIIVEILKMMTSCLDKSAVGLGCLTGYFSGMD